MSDRPRHVDPPPGAAAATAPYNFVPLPERVLAYAEVPGAENRAWNQHHRIVPDLHHGHIELTLTTLTPTYIRGPRLQRDGTWDAPDQELPEAFQRSDGRPVLPGASLRGMIRTVFEILTFSDLNAVNDRPAVYRTVAPDRLGDNYRARVIPGRQKPAGGYVMGDPSGWSIKPAEVLRVTHTQLTQAGIHLAYEHRPDYEPPAAHHGREIWVKVDRGDIVELSTDHQRGLTRARLVLTGSAPKKKHEFVFVDTNSAPIPIPDAVWEWFHSDAQISNWQKKRFRRDRPPVIGAEGGPNYRRFHGATCAGEPVFYLPGEDEAIACFGRAQMFRVPYDLSPAALLHQHTNETEPTTMAPDSNMSGDGPATDQGPSDLATAVLGTIHDDLIVKSRVSFSSAVAVGEAPDHSWYEPSFKPKVLASPNPTAYPQYLTQNGTTSRRNHTTYFEQDFTTIRGHKLYWHRPTKSPITLARETDPSDPDREDRVHTEIEPVKAGVTFKARIRFRNLTTVELGAVLAAVNLPAGCAHRLGMAKSLGLGSVHLDDVRLLTINPRARYCNDPNARHIIENPEIAAHCIQTFESVVDSHAQGCEEPTLNGEGLRRFERLDALYTLLSFDDAPDPGNTEHMHLDRFRDRLVLPTPQRVVGRSPAPVPTNRFPQPGPNPEPQAPSRRDSRDDHRSSPGPQHTPPPAAVMAMTMTSTTKKGGPVLSDETGYEYVFDPRSPLPPQLTEGDEVLVTIARPPGDSPGDRGAVPLAAPADRRTPPAL